jgi:lipocalin
MEQAETIAVASPPPAKSVRSHAPAKATQHKTAPRPATRIIIVREHEEHPPRYYGEEGRRYQYQPRPREAPRIVMAPPPPPPAHSSHHHKQRMIPSRHHGAVYTGGSSAGGHHAHHARTPPRLLHHRRSLSDADSDSAESSDSDASSREASMSEEDDDRVERHHRHDNRHAAEAPHRRHATPHAHPAARDDRSTQQPSKRARLRSWLKRRARHHKERISSVARDETEAIAAPSNPAPTPAAPAFVPMPMPIMQPMMYPMAPASRYRDEDPSAQNNSSSSNSNSNINGHGTGKRAAASTEPRGFEDEAFYFELEKFCGMPWYDIAHIRPKWDRWVHSRKSMKDVTSFYTLLPRSSKEANHRKAPHKFQVQNSAMRGKHLASISGMATIDTEYQPSTLGDPLVKATVEFPAVARTLFPSAAEISGDFWIFHVEPGAYQQDPYKWTIVADGEKRFCWLKARTAELGPGDMAKARAIVSAMGISPDRLDLVQHQADDAGADSD